MGVIVEKHLPCLDPVCGSSDARALYEDGTSYCFSCSGWFGKEGSSGVKPITDTSHLFKKPKQSYVAAATLDEIKTFPIQGIMDRGISKEVAEFFNVRVSFDSAGKAAAYYYPYGDGDNSYKVRTLPKDFTWVNKSADLFGKSKFNAGGKRVIVVEGEVDTLTIGEVLFRKYNKIYPVVGLSSSVMTKSLLENRDWLRSFGEIVLMFDNDEAGEKATKEAIKYLGVDKVKIVKYEFNDPNELFLKKGQMTVMQAMFDAAPYVPSGIITKDALWSALSSYNEIESHPYPECLKGLNTKLKGKRVGEIVLFISGTGSGKSTILREIILDIINTTTDKVGVVSLEESPAETARKLAGMAINRNPANEEIAIEDLKIGFDEVFGQDRVVILDHQGSINDNSIVEQLEYMALIGCKYLFIDHITIMVSEGVENLTGNEAQDKVMNDLLRLVKRHPVWVGLVSHLRKAPSQGKSFEEGKLPSIDDVRGSGSIKQISFDIVATARNLTAQTETERNTILARILKARFTGLTGDVRGANYTHETGRLRASLMDINEEFTSLP